MMIRACCIHGINETTVWSSYQCCRCHFHRNPRSQVSQVYHGARDNPEKKRICWARSRPCSITTVSIVHYSIHVYYKHVHTNTLYLGIVFAPNFSHGHPFLDVYVTRCTWRIGVAAARRTLTFKIRMHFIYVYEIRTSIWLFILYGPTTDIELIYYKIYKYFTYVFLSLTNFRQLNTFLSRIYFIYTQQNSVLKPILKVPPSKCCIRRVLLHIYTHILYIKCNKSIYTCFRNFIS